MIQLKKVTKILNGRRILDDMSLNIKRGEILYLLGKSGTGKSVLLKNIVGLMRPDSGDICIDGVSTALFSEEDFFEIRKKCGMVFQQPALLDDLNVYENVSYGLVRDRKLSPQDVHERVMEALRSVYLFNIEHKQVHQLSYGMQKRVSLARTIALKPLILLFDEPTTGLDPVSSRGISALIKELSHKLGTTSIVVSHDMKSAMETADRIVFLDGGKILTEGPPETIRRSDSELVRDFLADYQWEKGVVE